jgi:hypothetical protein
VRQVMHNSLLQPKTRMQRAPVSQVINFRGEKIVCLSILNEKIRTKSYLMWVWQMPCHIYRGTRQQGSFDGTCKANISIQVLSEYSLSSSLDTYFQSILCWLSISIKFHIRYLGGGSFYIAERFDNHTTSTIPYAPWNLAMTRLRTV